MTQSELTVIPLFPPAAAAPLAERAQRIRELVGVARHCIIDIGRELIAASEEVERGDWEQWLHDEFAWSPQTARQYIAVAKSFPSLPGGGGSLAITIDAKALYALSSPGVPQAVRDEAVERAEAGEKITKTEAEEMVRRAVSQKAAEAETAMREAIEAASDGQEEAVRAAIADANKRLAKDRKALADEVSRIRKAAETPDTNSIAASVCIALGISKLTDTHWQTLAQLLGQGISIGNKTFAPTSRDELREHDEKLRLASTVTEAVQALAGSPPPSDLLASCYPVQRALIREQLDVISGWVTGCRKALKNYAVDEI